MFEIQVYSLNVLNLHCIRKIRNTSKQAKIGFKNNMFAENKCGWCISLVYMENIQNSNCTTSIYKPNVLVFILTLSGVVSCVLSYLGL